MSAADAAAWAALEREVIACRRCPRLVAWREEAAAHPRAAFRGEEYWARPAPGFGDPAARILLLGLAPAAHGANRTGRIFTGDRSGDFLWAALHRAGLASQPTGRSLDDGLRLRDCYVTAAVRCAPPRNRPTSAERDACAPFLATELDLLRELRVIVCLGGFAWTVALRALDARGMQVPHVRLKFGHGAAVMIDNVVLLGCYHPSQQNTFTGRLTAEMLDEVMARARNEVWNARRARPEDAFVLDPRIADVLGVAVNIEPEALASAVARHAGYPAPTTAGLVDFWATVGVSIDLMLGRRPWDVMDSGEAAHYVMSRVYYEIGPKAVTRVVASLGRQHMDDAIAAWLMYDVVEPLADRGAFRLVGRRGRPPPP